MGDLIPFPGITLDEPSDEVDEFCENHWGPLMAAVEALSEARTVEQFRTAREELRVMVNEWSG